MHSFIFFQKTVISKFFLSIIKQQKWRRMSMKEDIQDVLKEEETMTIMFYLILAAVAACIIFYIGLNIWAVLETVWNFIPKPKSKKEKRKENTDAIRDENSYMIRFEGPQIFVICIFYSAPLTCETVSVFIFY